MSDADYNHVIEVIEMMIKIFIYLWARTIKRPKANAWVKDIQATEGKIRIGDEMKIDHSRLHVPRDEKMEEWMEKPAWPMLAQKMRGIFRD